ncbi:MAG: hypothetical protein HGB34_01615 [Candidatus Moranbacteria bacterium]|nr:hypothetical protein [Candidatus Moranbacteria bacterium]
MIIRVRFLFVIAAVLVCFAAPSMLLAGHVSWNERFVTLDPGEVPLGIRRKLDIRSTGVRVLNVDVYGARLLDPSGTKDMREFSDVLYGRNMRSEIPYAVMVYSHPKHALTNRERNELANAFVKAIPGKQGYLIFIIGQEQSGCVVRYQHGNESRAAAELTRIVVRSGGKLDLRTGRLSCMRPHLLLEALE